MEVEPIRKLEDVKRMYHQLLETATPREAECWIIGCNLALRAGDLLKLRFDQIDADYVTIIEQKTGKRKQFPVTKVVRDAVERLRIYYEGCNPYKTKEFKAEYLFQATSRRVYHLTQPLCIQWLGRKLKEAANELELGYNVNTHSMRKTWGYHAYERGEDIFYLQAMFNHACQKTTLRYIGITKTALEKMYHTNTLEIA